MPKQNEEKDITAIFKEGTAIDQALKRALREAIQKHKQFGMPMIIWEDGEMKSISPEEMERNLDRIEQKTD